MKEVVIKHIRQVVKHIILVVKQLEIKQLVIKQLVKQFILIKDNELIIFQLEHIILFQP